MRIVEGEPELTNLMQEVNVLDLTAPTEAVDAYLARWAAILGDTSPELELADQGYRFWKKNEKPSLGRITAEVMVIIETVLANKRVLYLPSSPTAQKQQIIDAITEVVKQVIRGYILLPSMQALKEAKKIILKYPSFFKRAGIAKDTVMETAAWLHAIENARLDPDITIRELEEARPLASSMISVFESLQTPDRFKTIQEHINIFLEKTKEGPYKALRIDPNFVADGYNMAIRGENVSVWTLVLENSLWLKGKSPFYDYQKHMHLECIPGDMVRDMIDSIQRGYAGSYYLAYLEKELKKKDQPIELINSDLVRADRQVAGGQIKWGGQCNQVYALLQELKAIGLVNNTNQELAPILKELFDVFRDTKASTIERELGRKQKLPKARRLEVKKMITSENTP
ncbi:hypothetical protein [Paraflavitalea soli]|nr:hypothetical protein [Paraflavitalea soli]